MTVNPPIVLKEHKPGNLRLKYREVRALTQWMAARLVLSGDRFVDNLKGIKSETTLLHLASGALLVSLTEYLCRRGHDPNAMNADGETPLKIAALVRDDFYTVEALLRWGANPNPETARVARVLGHRDVANIIDNYDAAVRRTESGPVVAKGSIALTANNN